MRILHLADRLTDRGGAYRHSLALLRALTEAGHEVWVGAGRHELDVGLPLRRAPALASRVGAPGDFERLVARARPDVVHLHTVVNPAALEWASARPCVITVQDHRYFCPARGKWTLAGEVCRDAMARGPCAACFEDEAYAAQIIELTLERLRALRRLSVIVLSRYMRDQLAALGVGSRVIPPFVDDLREDAPVDGPACVAFVGRLDEKKGALDAAEAWRRSGVALPLLAAGVGPLREQLLRRGVECCGFLDRRALSSLLRRARALLMPSRWQEPFGIAGLEALRFGVPVVAYDSGGIREWHPGPGLVPWGDIGALASALRAAVETRAQPATGFEREALMASLLETYQGVRRPALEA